MENNRTDKNFSQQPKKADMPSKTAAPTTKPEIDLPLKNGAPKESPWKDDKVVPDKKSVR